LGQSGHIEQLPQYSFMWIHDGFTSLLDFMTVRRANKPPPVLGAVFVSLSGRRIRCDRCEKYSPASTSYPPSPPIAHFQDSFTNNRVVLVAMRKIVLLTYCFGILHLIPVSSQDIQKEKDRLPGLSGTAKATCLNEIARYYVRSPVAHFDSGLLYAKRAFDYSSANNYKQAACNAARLYADILLQTSQPNEGLRYYQYVIRTAGELNNEWLKAKGIRGAGQALWYKGQYAEAIDSIRRSIYYFKRQKVKTEISDAIMTIGTIYADQGNYEKAFESAQEAVRTSQQYKDKENTILSHAELGKLYRSIGDYNTALDYYRKGYSFDPPVGHWPYRHLAHCMGDLYADREQWDSVLYYYRQSFAGNPDSKMSKVKMGGYHLARKNYDSAFYYFNELFISLNNSGEGGIVLDAMLGLAEIYMVKGQFEKALTYAGPAFQRAYSEKARLNVRDASYLLYRIYDSLKRPADALVYYRHYVQTKDSILTDKFKARLTQFTRTADDDRKQARIRLLEKERQISSQKLRENRFFRNILGAGILLLIITGMILFVIISLKRSNERLKSEQIQIALERRAADLEMQALRAQMNPHFIFNCLSSINRFILKNEPDMASGYLTRFSRLIRLVLVNSQKPLIVLEDEIEMLRLYIGLEQLRFGNSFDYSITYTNDIKPSNILIPPLLLQPFCENAIWHGLMHKKERGSLDITFTMKKDSLYCMITDNGVGRAKAAEVKSRSGEKIKSLGLQLTTERLALFNQDKSVQTSYRIEDMYNESGEASGTRIILEIRYKTFTEETV
jgi:tetratricopeptide (TPR) repeat protein